MEKIFKYILMREFIDINIPYRIENEYYKWTFTLIEYFCMREDKELSLI